MEPKRRSLKVCEMSTTLPNVHARATLDDLYREEGKAELIGGRIVRFMATGLRPNQVAGNIYASLRELVRKSRRGVACTDNLGFAVPELTSGRESFSPDAAYYLGPLPANDMAFIEGPPTFAVEVRSQEDYGGPSVEAELAAKRADYFEAGTLVVWDVDPVEERVRVYRADAPDQPESFARPQSADAEPALPGWKLSLDEIFGA
jgi:Uma2 family endonuclease